MKSMAMFLAEEGSFVDGLSLRQVSQFKRVGVKIGSPRLENWLFRFIPPMPEKKGCKRQRESFNPAGSPPVRRPQNNGEYSAGVNTSAL
jgi:hypothetical protein